MIDLEQEVEIIWGNNRKIYEPLGYAFTHRGDAFKVKLKDLAKQSSKEIEVMCDYCENIYYTKYCSYNRFKRDTKINKDACFNCRHQKRYESNILSYGSKSHNTNQKTFDKIAYDFDKRNLVLLKSSDKNITSKTRLFYKCKTHSNTIENMSYACFKQGVGCKKCAIEKSADKYRKSFSEIKLEFENRNLILLSDNYENYYSVLKYMCPAHKDKGIQETTFAALRKSKYGCVHCSIESNSGEGHYKWNGGTTPLVNYFREYLKPWVFDSLKVYDFKCALSKINDGTLEVHHLYSYTNILTEVLNENNFKIDNIINAISQDEINLIAERLLKKHYELGLGIPLKKTLHQKFHQEYSYHNSTPEQFSEFKVRFAAGEFNDQLAM